MKLWCHTSSSLFSFFFSHNISFERGQILNGIHSAKKWISRVRRSDAVKQSQMSLFERACAQHHILQDRNPQLQCWYNLWSRNFKEESEIETVVAGQLITQDTEFGQQGIGKVVPRYDKRLNFGGDCVRN